MTWNMSYELILIMPVKTKSAVKFGFKLGFLLFLGIHT